MAVHDLDTNGISLLRNPARVEFRDTQRCPEPESCSASSGLAGCVHGGPATAELARFLAHPLAGDAMALCRWKTS